MISYICNCVLSTSASQARIFMKGIQKVHVCLIAYDDRLAHTKTTKFKLSACSRYKNNWLSDWRTRFIEKLTGCDLAMKTRCLSNFERMPRYQIKKRRRWASPNEEKRFERSHALTTTHMIIIFELVAREKL